MAESMFYGSSPIIFSHAKKLRNELTGSEVIFWGLLKQYFSDYKFRRQHPISQYIADFYCHKLKVIIEIDGGIHLSNEVKNNDKVRDDFMESLGFKIIRFTNDEVCKNGEIVVKELNEFIESLKSKTSF